MCNKHDYEKARKPAKIQGLKPAKNKGLKQAKIQGLPKPIPAFKRKLRELL
jgi:hypothetical protein